MSSSPYRFDEFFSSDQEESISPFLTEKSRNWGKNLLLKRALFSAVLLFLSLISSFYIPAVSHILLSFVFFLVGIPAFLNALEDLKNLEINIDILMTLAAFLSLVIGSGLEGGLLLVLFELSSSMEQAVTAKTKGTLHKLNQLAPKRAFLVDNEGKVYEKSIHEISTGTKILVKAGEIVPLDGIIDQGASSFNLVHLTGESTPILKKQGEEVPAGAQNLETALTLTVTKKSADSTLTKIIQLITEAASAKPKLQKILDRFSKTYATSIIGLTFAFALFLPWIFSIEYLGEEGAIYRALAFMIAASPCALIIATPTAYLSAINACARKGILLKGGIILDALASCTKVAFDKTGTLTKGQLQLERINSLVREDPTIDDTAAIRIAVSLERHIVHPIAKAVEQYAEDHQAKPIEIENFQSQPGFGLEGIIEWNNEKVDVAIGLSEFIADKLNEKQKLALIKTAKQITSEGHILAILKVKNNLFAFLFSDTLRENTADLLEKMKEYVSPIMLTGDHKVIAKNIADSLNIEEFFADLRPEDKLRKVADLSQTTGLAMVGDGINDAPALARATVGISMGKIGSTAAVDASDVVLLHDDLHLLDWLFKRAHKTRKIVKENLTLALAVICLATTPALLGWIPLWLAVILHEGGTVLVGLNSLRLLRS